MPDRPDVNPDPLTDRLGRFTPEAAGLDRAAILFEAGRASVRGPRLWPGVAGLLAITQVFTLVLLFSRPTRPDVPAPEAARPAERAEPLTPTPGPPSPEPDRGVVRVGMTGDPLELPPEVPEEGLVSSGPTLAVSAGLRDAPGWGNLSPE